MSPSFQRGNANSHSTSSTPSISFSTSSSSSSLSSLQSLQPLKTPKLRSMEEVWRDINLCCLDDTPSSAAANMILQDFLATAPPPSRKHHSWAGAAQVSPADDDVLMLSSRPATMLSLNSSISEFQYIANEISAAAGRQQQNHHQHADPHDFNGRTTVAAFPSPGAAAGIFSPAVANIFKERPQNHHQDHSSGDRRHKRMIKNRESAARSRARKQAYTQELEMEVNQLREENARLRQQQKNLFTDEVQFTKRKKLYRTSTAPF